jgi:hypothetical protein
MWYVDNRTAGTLSVHRMDYSMLRRNENASCSSSSRQGSTHNTQQQQQQQEERQTEQHSRACEKQCFPAGQAWWYSNG